MFIGYIISSEKDLYQVRIQADQNGPIDHFTVASQGRGVFREKKITPTVGDKVKVDIQEETATIMEVFPRKNLLFRPPVANIDQVLVVQTINEPDINPLAFDKLLVVLEKRNLPIILAFNKIDRVSNDILNEWRERYKKAFYSIYSVNALSGEGMKDLELALANKITAIAGPSGAGKSTLIRRLTGDETVNIGNLSAKTARGKQTTRKIQLYEINEDSYIFDTPGFSSLDLRDFESGIEIAACFPEIKKVKDECKFRNCTHRLEPGCGVREKVEKKEIDPLRYQNYLTLFEEIEANRPY